MKRIFLLFYLFGTIVFGYFENTEDLEKIVFGFNINENLTFEQRLKSIEIKTFGNENQGDIKKREDDLYTLLFKSGRNICINDKVNYMYIKVFKKLPKSSILKKIENLENELLLRIFNNYSIVKRVDILENYLDIDFSKDELFDFLSNKLPKEKNVKNIIIKPKNNEELEVGDRVTFKIINSSANFFDSKDIIIGIVTGKKESFIFKDKYILDFETIKISSGEVFELKHTQKLKISDINKLKQIKLENLKLKYFGLSSLDFVR